MYAFRKPFTVGVFEELSLFGIDYKIVLIIAQVFGYTFSKFMGIKMIAELKPKQRFPYILSMIFLAEVSLFFFGLVAFPYNFLFMFLNGISLGMIWGIVFSYLEGRKFTEILSIALCSSFILSSGAVKSVGLLVLTTLQVSEFWMPAITGAIFIFPFVFFSKMLDRIPPPTEDDKILKKERNPMTFTERKKVFKNFLFPIVILVLFYMTLTALRDFRDNFSRELWDSLGFEGNASVYTLSEIPVAFFVFCLLGSIGFVKNNFKAFLYYHYLLVLGSILLCLSTLLHQSQLISPMLWMILIGFGMYICYVPFNGIFFDRMIATFRINSNAGYFIYIADAFGYLSSVGILLYKNFGQKEVSWLSFFVNAIYTISVLGFIISIISLIYFKRKRKKESFVLN